MSELGDLEAAVVGVVSGIQSGGQPVFLSVEGFSDPDRRRSAAHLGRRVPPAGLVIYTGRLRTTVEGAMVGLPRLTVLIAAENLRGGDDPRAGDGVWRGGFELLGLVTAALDGVTVLGDRRLGQVDEQVASADDTHVVYEQRYVVDRVTELIAPTFDSVALAGAGSLVQVIVGVRRVETASFAFSGIDGEFRHQLGLRGREIVWKGQLRASTDVGLSAIETGIEDAVANPGSFTMVDSWSRSFSGCVCDRFVRVGRRTRHPVSGFAVQPFEIHFTQLGV